MSSMFALQIVYLLCRRRMTLFWSFLFVVSERPNRSECIASAKCVYCIISIENENDMFRDCTNLNALHWNENQKRYCCAFMGDSFHSGSDACAELPLCLSQMQRYCGSSRTRNRIDTLWSRFATYFRFVFHLLLNMSALFRSKCVVAFT